MRQHLKELAVVLYITVAYFGAVTFAVAALEPRYRHD